MMNLFRLLIAHGVVTLAAAVVLVVAPSFVPATVGIVIGANTYLLCYLLGTAELAIATLSFGAARLRDRAALRLVSGVFVVFHATTALVEVYAFVQGVDPLLWINVAVRVVAAALFLFYGFAPSAEHADASSTEPSDSRR